LVPGFEAIFVEPSDLVEGKITVPITPPLIFDVADPSPNLFFRLPADLGQGDICYNDADASPEGESCGYQPLGNDDVVKRKFSVGVSRVSWFGEDYSGNKSPINEQIVNIHDKANKISIATNNTFTVGGVGFNPTLLTINSTNPDDDPVKYLIESNPNQGILKSPLDPVFQNKIQEAGKTSALRGLEYSEDGDYVYFPDSLNNRVMKVLQRLPQIPGPKHLEE